MRLRFYNTRMNTLTYLDLFKDSDAILSGHFILSSGLHSDTYIQCARALMNPKRAEKLCAALADKIRQSTMPSFNIVIAPAMGGVIVGYEMARQFGMDGIFCERVDGNFTFRRGFVLEPHHKALLVEDVVTTGKSSLETVDCVQSHGAEVVAACSLVNRSGTAKPLGTLPYAALIDVEVQTFEPSDIPESLKDIPAVKPGSRFLNQKKAS